MHDITMRRLSCLDKLMADLQLTDLVFWGKHSRFAAGYTSKCVLTFAHKQGSHFGLSAEKLVIVALTE